jgi:hypothetical protein
MEWLCEKCGTVNCFECRRSHHNMTCDGAIKDPLADEELREVIRRTTKKCPAKDCGVPIEKDEGCMVMKCNVTQPLRPVEHEKEHKLIL